MSTKARPIFGTQSRLIARCEVGAGVAPGRDDMRRAGSGLEDLLERIRRIDGDHDPVDLEAVLVHVGRRSFGGIVLFAGIVAYVAWLVRSATRERPEVLEEYDEAIEVLEGGEDGGALAALRGRR